MPHVDFKQRTGWFRKVGLAGRAIYSLEARRRIRGMIAEFRPDVAHVRNIYHHLSPSILWELKAQKVPVVYHLNDFKVLCASYNLVCARRSLRGLQGRGILARAEGEMLSGMGRADDAGGGGLFPQMAGHVP